jgi:hypothetical protein
MKKLLFVLFALMAATLVIGLTVAMTRSVDADPETIDEDTADEGAAA